MPRKKSNESENTMVQNETAVETNQIAEDLNEEKQETINTVEDIPIPAEETADNEESRPDPEHPKLKLGVLKLQHDDEEQEDDAFETLWNELGTFYRSRRFVPVIVTGIERTKLAGNVVVTYYKDQRILVPLTEMMINLSEERGEGYTLTERLERICNTMLGAEIDVIIKGIYFKKNFLK